VVASRFEGFDLTAVEAMTAGTAALCSSQADVAEHVARAGCGVLAEPTAEALTTGLVAILRRRAEWPKMAQAGQEYVTAGLSWQRVAVRVAAQYRQLLEGSAEWRRE
jgi:glycosyltransferase involved in cell wall biosynthesis